MEIVFTPKEERFISEYLKDFNATQSAMRAGYSKTSARQIGSENLSKPYIKAEIQKRLIDLSLGKEETKKLITDIATSNVSNFFKKVRVERSERLHKGLNELIIDLKNQIQFEDQYAVEAALSGKELLAHEKGQQSKRRQIIRYKLELEQNPNAYRIVSGETKLVDDVELDLVALCDDKEGARVKSIKNGKYGLEVDLLPADGALTNMARIHGLFKDNIDVNMKGSISPDKWLEDNSDGKA
jgi:phage terminase small subunit